MRTLTASLRSVGAAALLVLSGSERAALAQPSGRPPQPGWSPSATLTPWFQGSADVDGGGGFSATGAILRAGVDGPIGGGHRAGLTFTYGHTEYDFSSATSFGQGEPWTDVDRVGVAATFLLRGPGPWGFLVSPSVDYFLEDGADWSEAQTYGALFGVSRRFGPDLLLGLGAGVFDQLDEVEAFPLILIDWKIGERLRLVNPLPAGPTGGAGLELSYLLDGGWTLGVGGAMRSARFRLRDDGPFPNGIGGERAFPAFAHVGRRVGQSFALDVYGGAMLGGWVRVEDSAGHEVAERDFDPAPLVGGTVSARF